MSEPETASRRSGSGGEPPLAPPRPADTRIGWAERWDHGLARIGWRRGEHRVDPGLYAVGRPDASAPVLVTANYTLSFDALREQLAGIDTYILVLDTGGVNVWCAAGKGTFSTASLVDAIRDARLDRRVAHRRVIVPQLGAVGVAGWRVRKESGFRVDFGPVRAEDIPAYLVAGKATREMRRVRFTLRDRMVLTPVELRNYLLPAAVTTLALYLLAGPLAASAAVAALLAGVFLFPALLPRLPAPSFTVSGFALGLAASIPFAVTAWAAQNGDLVASALAAAPYPLLMGPAVAFVSLNFTGSTPFTSQSGVRREIARYTRPVVAAAAAGILTLALRLVFDLIGGA